LPLVEFLENWGNVTFNLKSITVLLFYCFTVLPTMTIAELMSLI